MSKQFQAVAAQHAFLSEKKERLMYRDSCRAPFSMSAAMVLFYIFVTGHDLAKQQCCCIQLQSSVIVPLQSE